MTKKEDIYKCNICGNIVKVLDEGIGELVCCNQPMEKLEEKTADVSLEKHVPYIEETETGYLVKIGKNEDHPMLESHYIEWIELKVDNITYIKRLSPGDKPLTEFIAKKGKKVSARAYCNLHSLWKN